MDPKNEFVSTGVPHKYPFKIGKHVASSLSGFIAGVIVASIIWFAVAYMAKIILLAN
jgi:hypothetical protein